MNLKLLYFELIKKRALDSLCLSCIFIEILTSLCKFRHVVAVESVETNTKDIQIEL